MYRILIGIVKLHTKKIIAICASFLFFMCVFVFYGCIPSIWKFVCRGLNLNSICRTHASAVTQASAVGFLTHCATVGTPHSCFFFKQCYQYKLLSISEMLVEQKRISKFLKTLHFPKCYGILTSIVYTSFVDFLHPSFSFF